MPDPTGVAKVMPDLTKTIAQTASSPRYAALKGASTEQPAPEKSFGVAGLLPSLSTVGPLAIAGAPLAASAAPIAAAAYGIGKAVAPEWTDKTVGKIRDWLSQGVNKAEAKGSAYETGMAESLPASKFIEKALPQNVQNYLSMIKSQHPDFAWAGHTAGVVGQMAIPGANIIKGAGLLGTAANAAINAAPYAVGQGMDTYAQTGDLGKSIKSGLISEAAGTIIPTGISGLAQIPSVARWLAKVQLGGAGIKTGDEVKNLRSFATHSLGLRGPAVDSYVASHADDLTNHIAGLVDKFGQGRQGKINMREWNDKGFDAHNDLYEAVTGNHVTTEIGQKAGMSDADHVLSDPDLNEEVQGLWKPDKIQESVQRIGGMVDGQSWNRARNTILRSIIEDGKNAHGQLVGTGPNVLDAHVAQAWRDQIDSIADRSMAWAKKGALGPEAQEASADVPDLHVLKTTYPAIQSIKKAQGREEPMIPNHFAPNSDTFIRAATEAAMTGTMGPAGALASQVAGPIIARTVGKGLSKGAGLAAGALRNAGEVPSAAIGRASAQMGNLPDMISGPTMAPGPAMGQAVPAPAPEPAGAPATIPMQPIPNAPAQPPAPTPAQAMGNANDAMVHAADAPRNVPGFNPTAMQERLQEWYQVHTRRMGNDLSFDDFTNQLKQATNGFSPDNPLTYKIMLDDPSEAERIFKAHMTLKKMDGFEIGDALNYYTHKAGQLGGTRFALGGDVARTQDMAHTQLIDALHGMGLGDTKEIEARLKKIAWNKDLMEKNKGAGAKQAIADWISNQGGIPVKELMDLGLWH
jgi:hypothetical protein